MQNSSNGFNDSIESLLSRHYGSTAPVPTELEQRLYSSLQQRSLEMHHQQHTLAHLRAHRFGRRHAVRLVALGSAGLGILSIGMEGLQLLESALTSEDVAQPVFP